MVILSYNHGVNTTLPPHTHVRFLLNWQIEPQGRNLLTENLYKIKSIRAEFQSFIIAHDMTNNERQQCRSLVSDVKQKTAQESGEWRYVVRGMMKIVKLRKIN